MHLFGVVLYAHNYCWTIFILNDLFQGGIFFVIIYSILEEKRPCHLTMKIKTHWHLADTVHNTVQRSAPLGGYLTRPLA